MNVKKVPQPTTKKLNLRCFTLTLIVLLVGCGVTAPKPSAATPEATRPLITASAAPSPAPQGVTYYVALDGNDDHNDGSEDSPWRTIQHAVEQVAPGDTILVKSGAYEGARIERSGTAQAWITLKAAPGASVVINAPGPENAHQSNVEIETWEGDGIVAYWIIEGLEVQDAPGWGIDVRGDEAAKSHHITVRGTKVHDNGVASGKTGIFAAFSDDVLIENNESYNNGEHGIYVNNSSDRFTIRANRLYGNANCGVHLNGDASAGGDGILSAGLVENNVIYENGIGGGSAINMDGVTATVVRNNLLYHNHATGIAIFQGDGAVCSQDNQVFHNTILVAGDGRWALKISDTGCVGNRVLNNIFYSYHGYRGSINVPAGLSSFESDYNVVVDRFTTDDGDSVITLAEWQALGYDAHSFIATPDALFVSPSGRVYHLREGSPAIDAGSDQAGVSADLEGHPRPWGDGFDIGAYEYTLLSERAYLPLVASPTQALSLSARQK